MRKAKKRDRNSTFELMLMMRAVAADWVNPGAQHLTSIGAPGGRGL